MRTSGILLTGGKSAIQNMEQVLFRKKHTSLQIHLRRQVRATGRSFRQARQYGDSPYQSFSTFAGNPYFIDLEKLIKKGWITKDECKAYDFGDNAGYVDYEKIYNCRYEILRKAYEKKPDRR